MTEPNHAQESALIALIEKTLDEQNAHGLERAALGEWLRDFARQVFRAALTTRPPTGQAPALLERLATAAEAGTLPQPRTPQEYAAAEQLENLRLGTLTPHGEIILTHKGEKILDEYRAAVAAQIRALGDPE